MAKYKVMFLPMGVTVEVDPSLYPYSREGLPGSLLDIALSHGVAVDHACGGTGVCGTCHVIVQKGMENLSEPSDDEMDTVNAIPDTQLSSRLACQAVVKGDVTVTVANPEE